MFGSLKTLAVVGALAAGGLGTQAVRADVIRGGFAITVPATPVVVAAPAYCPAPVVGPTVVYGSPVYVTPGYAAPVYVYPEGVYYGPYVRGPEFRVGIGLDRHFGGRR